MNQFLIQLSLKSYQIQRHVEALKKVGADYSFFSVYSDCDKVANFPEQLATKNFISLAGIKALKISCNPQIEHFLNEEEYLNFATQYKKSFFYKDKDKFDQNYYNNLDISLPLVNKDALYFDLNKELYKVFEEDMFIKPSSDLKGFTAGIIKQGQSIFDYIHTTSRQKDWMDELVLISPLKKIHSEYRFFIVNKEVVASSRYRLMNESATSPIIPKEVLNKAHELSKLYQPDKVFTMDLALLENENIEIMEYNCFNGSGTYKANLEDLFNQLMELNLDIKPKKTFK
jgi:hypothetical protein